MDLPICNEEQGREGSIVSLIDISRVIDPMSTVYPGDSQVEFEAIASLTSPSSSDPCNITEVKNFTTHLLTHVDVPRHFLAEGKTLEEIPLSRFTGPAIVVDVSGKSVESHNVPAGIPSGLNILFRTNNSSLGDSEPFPEDHVYVSEGAAAALVEARVNLVGFDSLSVDRFGDEEYPAHKTLLGHDILILEGLRLAEVAPGEYVLYAFPLRIARGDGSPVRAILMSEGSTQ
jgi:arylformamidase